MKRALFILKRRQDYTQDPSYTASPQIATGMYNSSKFVVDELLAVGIEAKLEIVVDNNDINRVVHEYEPTDVFIEGLWVVPEKFDVLKPLHPKVRWHARIHSEIPFLATEGNAMAWIAGYLKRGVYVAPNAPRAHHQLMFLAKQLGVSRELIEYLPNCYPTDFQPVNLKEESDTLDVACFGAYRPMKNHLQQAMIALKYAHFLNKKLRFHVNAREDQGGQSPAKNVRALMEAVGAELVIHGWEDRDTFLQSLRDVHVLMQLSMSETFNIVAADATLVGTPVLASPEISWIYPVYGDPHSVDASLYALDKIMEDPEFFVHGNRTGLKLAAQDAAQRWEILLG